MSAEKAASHSLETVLSTFVRGFHSEAKLQPGLNMAKHIAANLLMR